MNNIKTVILHCKKLKDRKINMMNQMNCLGFSDYSFYEEYDGDELNQDIININYNSGIKYPDIWKKKVSLWGTPALFYHKPVCNIPEISLSIKYGKLFNKLKDCNTDMVLFLEDDVIFNNNFNENFNLYLNKTPNDWDAIYFGNGANLKPSNIVDDQIAYKKQHPASRCADTILMKIKTIKDLALTWFPFNLAADWELGYQHFFHNHNIYWWEPSLTSQGSQNGVFPTSIQGKG
jgi:hypothetical protein